MADPQAVPLDERCFDDPRLAQFLGGLHTNTGTLSLAAQLLSFVLTGDHSIALLFAFAFLRPDLKQCYFDDTSQLQSIAGQVCRDQRGLRGAAPNHVGAGVYGGVRAAASG